MTDDELVEDMKAAFDSVADSGMWTWDAAMRAVLAVVREHDGAELAAARAEQNALAVKTALPWVNGFGDAANECNKLRERAERAEAEAARLRAAFEWVMSWVDNWQPSFIYDEEWQGRVHEVRAALAQEGV